MNTKRNLLFILFFFFILQSSLELSDSDCTNTSPIEKTDCNILDIGTNKKCCFFSYGSTPSKKCSPISIASFDSMMTDIEVYKSTLADKTNFVSECGTQMEVCAKIINPQRDLACTGRKAEEPYSCCFIKVDKTNKSCSPINAKELQTIVNYAKSYKEKYNLSAEPEVVCCSGMVSLSLIAYLITYLVVLYI